MASTARARVLTAEDNPITRADLRLILEEGGYDVSDARDGEEAVRVARATKPDLILLDLSLPGLDGVEAASRIRAERKVPFVAITGYADGSLVSRARGAGAASVVLKPYPGVAILDAVRDAMATDESSAARVRSREALRDLSEALGHDRAYGDLLERRAFEAGKVWKRVQ
ncbi:MAG: response regulator [Gaiellales bacterium]